MTDRPAAPSPPLLSGAAGAHARHHTYALLSRLMLEGLTPALLPYAAALPPLAAALPEPYDADGAAADHNALFNYQIFPYEGLFTESDGMLGGPTSESLMRLYAEHGYRPAPDAAPDHLGYELALLAFLCGAEADALEDGLTTIAGQLRRRQRLFLTTHLLRWLPPLVAAIRRHEVPFHAAAADLLLALAADHIAVLGDAPVTPDPLPAPPDLMEDAETGLGQIATYLLTPLYSGLYLSRATLAALGRGHRLPRGFGDRRPMLLTLLRTAAQYDALPALLDDLHGLIDRECAVYEQIAADNPMLAPFVQPWRKRAAACGATFRGAAGQLQRFHLAAEGP